MKTRQGQLSGRGRETSPAARPAQAKGLTLIELLVTIAILAGMILGFAVVLSSAKSVVSTTQAQMRANAAAAAVAQVIREDFGRITKHGFLCIREGKLIFTTAGYHASLLPYTGKHGTGVTIAPAAVATYGTCANPAGSSPVLFRRSLLLYGSHIRQDRESTEDSVRWDLAHYQGMTASELSTAIDNDFLAGAPAALAVPPPNNLGLVQDLWQCLTHGVTDFSIEWTHDDVEGSGNIQWQKWTGGNNRLWTHHDPNAWPVAVKIRFRLVDRAMPEEFRDGAMHYEVICPIGR
jgi:prepilin-type N-terminal cleavage/methylation domain-containing protein